MYFQAVSVALKRASHSRPLRTAACTGFVVMSAGDAAAQLCSSDDSLNMKRNLVSATYNGAASPVFYKWYRLMDRVFPGTTIRTLIPKTIVSQLVTTGGNNPCFLTWCNCAEAWADSLSSPAAAVDWTAVLNRTAVQLRRELPNLYGSSMLFWLPVTGANFALVPDHLRILWVSTCSVLWGGFVSFVAHRRSGES